MYVCVYVCVCVRACVCVRVCVCADSEKSAEEQEAEKRVLAEMLEVVDMRNSLVTFLEEKRLKELSEPQLTSSLMETKRHSAAGAQVHWE